MKKNIFYFIILTSLLTTLGCDNGLTYNNTIDNKAKITVSILNRDGIPISGAKFSIYYGPLYSNNVIIEDVTSSSSEFKTTLIEGVYSVTCHIQDGSVYFTDQRNFMEIGGENLPIILKPFENIGNIRSYFTNGYPSYDPIKNTNIVLLTKSFNSYEIKNKTLSDLLAYNYDSKITDNSGYVEFNNLPLFFTFSLLIYIDENKWKYLNNTTADYNYTQHYSVDTW
ncbi:MAG: hypothetical protein HZB41_08100 [Ignavibacteriae bacterium]|nr:hypothetical protein [Ignavibacteriota bacterium]